MDDRTQKLVTMADGSQQYVEEVPGLVGMSVDSDSQAKHATVDSVQEINVSEKQRAQILKRIATEQVCYDENSGKVTFTPRESNE